MASASEPDEKKMWEVAGWGTVGVWVGRSGSCSMVEFHEEGVFPGSPSFWTNCFDVSKGQKIEHL